MSVDRLELEVDDAADSDSGDSLDVVDGLDAGLSDRNQASDLNLSTEEVDLRSCDSLDLFDVDLGTLHLDGADGISVIAEGDDRDNLCKAVIGVCVLDELVQGSVHVWTKLLDSRGHTNQLDDLLDLCGSDSGKCQDGNDWESEAKVLAFHDQTLCY